LEALAALRRHELHEPLHALPAHLAPGLDREDAAYVPALHLVDEQPIDIDRLARLALRVPRTAHDEHRRAVSGETARRQLGDALVSCELGEGKAVVARPALERRTEHDDVTAEEGDPLRLGVAIDVDLEIEARLRPRREARVLEVGLEHLLAEIGALVRRRRRY